MLTGCGVSEGQANSDLSRSTKAEECLEFRTGLFIMGGTVDRLQLTRILCKRGGV